MFLFWKFYENFIWEKKEKPILQLLYLFRCFPHIESSHKKLFLPLFFLLKSELKWLIVVTHFSEAYLEPMEFFCENN